MNSVEKVRAALDRVEEIAGDESMPAQVRGGALMAMVMRPKIEPMIPEDPAHLDAILERLAEWALGQRSDPEHALEA